MAITQKAISPQQCHANKQDNEAAAPVRSSSRTGPLVSSLSRNYAPDAAPRVFYVTVATRDQVNMGMVNGLSGCSAAVHADVEATY